MQEETPFDVRRLLRLARRHLVLILVCVVLGAAVAAAPLVLNGLAYSAQSQVQSGVPATIASVTAPADSVREDNARLMDAQLRRIQGARVADAVERRLPDGHAPYSVSFSGGTDTTVIEVEATSVDRGTATAVANAYGEEYVASLVTDNDALVASTQEQLSKSVAAIDEQLAKLQTTLSSADADSLSRIQAVVAPTRQALLDQRTTLQRQIDGVALYKSVGSTGGSKVIMTAETASVSYFALISQLLLGAIVGFLAGIGLTWLLESRRGTVRDEDDVRSTGLEPRSVITLADPGHAGGRMHSVLGLALFPTESVSRPTVLLPVDRHPGLSELALGVADELITLGRRVALVDATASSFSVGGSREVSRLDATTLMAQLAPVPGPTSPGAGVPQHAGLSGVDLCRPVLVSASTATAPGVLGSARFARAVEALASEVDQVIIVTDPLAGSGESMAALSLASRSVLLCRAGRTTRAELHRLADRVAGVALMFAALRNVVVVVEGDRRSDATAWPAGGRHGGRHGGRDGGRDRTAASADGSTVRSQAPRHEEAVARTSPSPQEEDERDDHTDESADRQVAGHG